MRRRDARRSTRAAPACERKRPPPRDPGAINGGPCLGRSSGKAERPRDLSHRGDPPVVAATTTHPRADQPRGQRRRTLPPARGNRRPAIQCRPVARQPPLPRPRPRRLRTSGPLLVNAHGQLGKRGHPSAPRWILAVRDEQNGLPESWCRNIHRGLTDFVLRTGGVHIR